MDDIHSNKEEHIPLTAQEKYLPKISKLSAKNLEGRYQEDGLPLKATHKRIPKMTPEMIEEKVSIDDDEESDENIYMPLPATEYLPKISRLSSKKKVKSGITYEMTIWNRNQHFNVVEIKTPAVITIGRKTKKESLEANNTPTKVCEIVEEKEGTYFYTLLVENDACLSRRHAEIYISHKNDFKPLLQDLGSTHGAVVYRDSSCHTLDVANIGSGGRTPFPCPEDQYLRMANTYFRIRPKDSAEAESVENSE